MNEQPLVNLRIKRGEYRKEGLSINDKKRRKKSMLITNRVSLYSDKSQQL